ncbi:MAG: ATP-binding protein [Actinomycetota bacterium]|nr:ATP-binding protein [Actinomycetota bacterium]
MADLEQVLRPIRAVAEAAQGNQETRDLLGRVCAAVADNFALPRVGLLRTDAKSRQPVVVVVAAAGVAAGQFELWRIDENPALARAARTGSPVFIADARTEPSFTPEAVVRLGAVSVLVLPLLAEGRLIGFLLGDRAGTSFELEAEQMDLLACIAVLVATLLEKELERRELERLDVAKSQFVALASHELRTPIATVYGVLATLNNLGGKLREEQRVELRATAFEQATRLRRLADQLLDLSRLDAVAISLDPQPLGVRRTLEEIVLMAGELRASEVAIEAAPDLEVILDRLSLERIVSNLLTNAMRHGEPPVRIEAIKQDCHLRVAVEDAGEGVPAEFVTRLFDRFSRAEQSKDRITEGTGLGLAIAQSFARAHGGEILYRDATPHGARFEFVIPLI